MRSLLRAKARANMRREGLVRINKPMFVNDGGVILRGPSFFARKWREWVDK